MNSEKKIRLLKKVLDQGEGIVRLAPAWVPRTFILPGGRLKLDPGDLYGLGAERGGICERWLASTTQADNGPGTPEDEGLSYLVIKEGSKAEKVLLKEAIELLGEIFLGKEVMEKYRGWMTLTKFFDNLGPIPHHLHQSDEHAEKVGRLGKPEAYYFPPQLNFTQGNFTYTFFGLEPGTTKQDILLCLKKWPQGENGILYHSRAYKLNVGDGWDIPPGILHAPGTRVTYEIQRASDVFAMFQSLLEGRPISWDLLVKDVPEDKHHDLDYLVGLIDWEANVDPEFMKNRYHRPIPAGDPEAMKDQGYLEKWIVYGSTYFSGKELIVFPGRSIITQDEAAYGLIVVQGRGKVGKMEVETPTSIRLGELTGDELFVTVPAASSVKITNTSQYENLVILKHFGPGNPATP